VYLVRVSISSFSFFTKTMKKQIMLGLILAVTLGACNQNGNVTPGTTTSAVVGAGRAATDSYGKGTTITADQLPAAATTYLTNDYTGYTLVQAVKGTDRMGATFYAVVIEQKSVRYHLHFDANGAFVASKGGHGPGMNDANETTITADALPAAITTYLTTTYPSGYTLVQAEQAADSAGVVIYYETVITSGGKAFQLNFDPAGNVLKGGGGKGGPGGPGGGKPMGTSLTATQLPPTVTTYLTTNYTGYTFGQAYQATTRDGVTVYAVMITQNSNKYFLLFDANGAFVSVRTGKH
jgi:hypothetical protein